MASRYYYGTGPATTVHGNTNDINNYTNIYQSAAPEPDPIFFNVKSAEKNFVGRLGILCYLKESFNEEISLDSNIIVISGLGGVGKTQLVRKFIQENRSSFKHVICINSASSQSMNESFKKLASNELKMSLLNEDGHVKESNDIIEQVFNKLSKSKTLLVYDNVDEIETISFLLTIEPSGKKPHVIITSRIQEWGDGIDVQQLKIWELDEAVAYVSKTLKDHLDEYNDKKSLVDKLQHFPLALRQATAYINYQRKERPFQIVNYLSKYDASHADTKAMLGNEIFKKDVTNIYTETTLTTWRITIDAIKQNAETGELASRILKIIAYFDPDNIHRDIFIHLTNKSDNRDAANSDFEEDDIRSAVRLLVNYSMVDSQEWQSVLSVHRLVQLVIKLDLRDSQQDKSIVKDALALIRKLIDRKHVKLQVSHSHLVSVYISALYFDDLVHEFSAEFLSSDILFTLCEHGKDNQVKVFGEKILQPLERILGADHPDTLSTRHHLATSYRELGAHSDAIKMFEELLEKQKIRLGEDHLDTLNTRHDVALSYLKLGTHSEAMQMFEELLTKQKIILGDDHSDTLRTRHHLALSYDELGKHSEAIQMFEEILEKCKNIFGEDHSHTLTARNNLASSYAHLGNNSVVIEMFEEVFKKRKNILGEDHPNTLAARHKIGVSYAALGKHSDAILMFEEILEKQKNILGEDHPDTLTTRHNVGISYLKLERYSDAIQMFEEVLEKSKNISGEDHPRTLTSRNNLAIAYKRLGKYSDAIQMFKEILEKSINSLG